MSIYLAKTGSDWKCDPNVAGERDCKKIINKLRTYMSSRRGTSRRTRESRRATRMKATESDVMVQVSLGMHGTGSIVI